MTIKELESCHNENTSLSQSTETRNAVLCSIFYLRSQSGTLQFKHRQESPILSFHSLTLEFVCIACTIQCAALNTHVLTDFPIFFCTETDLILCDTLSRQFISSSSTSLCFSTPNGSCPFRNVNWALLG